MKLIDISTPTFPNTFTMVDDEDYEALAKWRWKASMIGSAPYAHIYATRYLNRGGRESTTSIHRVLMGDPPGMIVDHINGDRLDNRKANIRVCTNQQNIRNSGKPRRFKKAASSQYKGVSFNKQKQKWQVFIYMNGKNKNLGSFVSELDALAAYETAAMNLHGEFFRKQEKKS